ncbi:cyclase family protein [Methanolobus sp. ZRKC5]|uniref:cyclase family protein n=1 Tax=unclassified Methanolobus TaxID=2629569 RepID=UPI00313CACA8
MLTCISYSLTKDCPLYPGSPDIVFDRVRSMANNDSANTSLLSFSNHSGTHVDAPLHFCDKGPSVADMLKTENVYSPVVCIDLPKSPGSYISADDLLLFSEQIANAEALLLRTGFYEYRISQPDVYSQSHPWVHPEVPVYLRETCPNLKIVGLDTISISNPSHRAEGHIAHKSFLCNKSPILLIEDMDLSNPEIVENSIVLRLYPWVVSKIDATPVIALLETDY